MSANSNDFDCIDETGKQLYVEVKGCRGYLDTVRLTKTEWKRAKELGDSYCLYIITNLDGDGDVYEYINPYELFDDTIKGPVVSVTQTFHINKKNLLEVLE